VPHPDQTEAANANVGNPSERKKEGVAKMIGHFVPKAPTYGSGNKDANVNAEVLCIHINFTPTLARALMYMNLYSG